MLCFARSMPPRFVTKLNSGMNDNPLLHETHSDPARYCVCMSIYGRVAFQLTLTVYEEYIYNPLEDPYQSTL